MKRCQLHARLGGDSAAIHQARERLQATRMATAVGTAKTTRKIGASSATEYPAFATPTHMLMPAATNHSGTKTWIALVSPTAVVGPPNQRPIRRHRARRTKPPAMTFRVCAIECVPK